MAITARTLRPVGFRIKGEPFRNTQASSPAEAILRGLFKQVRELLNKGADPNEEIYEARNALMLCTLIKDYQWTESLVRQLLECGGRLDQKDDHGNTALHYAIIKNRIDIIDVFFEASDFDLNIKNKLGFTPLHYAVDSNDKTEILKRILGQMKRYKFSLETPNAFLCTPLLEAIRHLNFDAIKILTDFDADTNFKIQGIKFKDFLDLLKNRCLNDPHHLLKIKKSMDLNGNEELKCHDLLILQIKIQSISMAPGFDVRNDPKCVLERPKSCLVTKTIEMKSDHDKSWKKALPPLLINLVEQNTKSYRKGLSIESIILSNTSNRDGMEISDKYGKGNKNYGGRKNGSRPKISKRGISNQDKMSKRKSK